MLATGSNYLVCPFETDQEAFMQKVWDRTDVRIRANSDVELISRGTWEQIRADAKLMIETLGGFGGGFIGGYYGGNEAIGITPEIQEIACKAFVEFGRYASTS